MGATSGLVTQLTLIGVLLGAPLAFAAQSAPTSTPMLTLIVLGTLVCLAAGGPIWMRNQGTQPAGLPGASSPIGVK